MHIKKVLSTPIDKALDPLAHATGPYGEGYYDAMERMTYHLTEAGVDAATIVEALNRTTAQFKDVR